VHAAALRVSTAMTVTVAHPRPSTRCSAAWPTPSRSRQASWESRTGGQLIPGQGDPRTGCWRRDRSPRRSGVRLPAWCRQRGLWRARPSCHQALPRPATPQRLRVSRCPESRRGGCRPALCCRLTGCPAPDFDPVSRRAVGSGYCRPRDSGPGRTGAAPTGCWERGRPQPTPVPHRSRPPSAHSS